MFNVGDIVRLYAPQAGYNKYHVCIVAGYDGNAHQFLYLNSDPSFDQTYVCDCSKIPCLPESETGKTAVSFAYLPRYNDAQLKLYKAEKLGEMDSALATEIHAFAEKVTVMTPTEKKVVLTALTTIKDGAKK